MQFVNQGVVGCIELCIRGCSVGVVVWGCGRGVRWGGCGGSECRSADVAKFVQGCWMCAAGNKKKVLYGVLLGMWWGCRVGKGVAGFVVCSCVQCSRCCG